jgi:hypothetical protein
VIFTATIRQMGPAQDRAPPVCCDDDAGEQKEALGTRFSTLRSEEAVQKKHGTHFGETSSCSGSGNQDQVTTLMKRSFNSL